MSDFGEAKLFIDKEGTGTIKGTKEYLAPEVNILFREGKTRIQENYDSHKSDIYSLGLVILYSNLKKLPFEMIQTEEFRKKELNFNPFEKERGPYDETIDDFIEEIVKAFTIKKKN